MLLKTMIIYIVWTPLRMYGEILTTYREDNTYADKLCTEDYLELEFFAPSIISCLITCLYLESSSASIYHKDSSMCYSIRAGYDGDCTKELAGAKMYRKDACPDGWAFIYKSCYTFIEEPMFRDNSMDACRNLSESAHLADIKTKVERESVQQGVRSGKLGNFSDLVWLGAVGDNNELKWSDGTPAVQNELPYIDITVFEADQEFYKMLGLSSVDGEYCITAERDVTSWQLIACRGMSAVFTVKALCELDI